MLDRRDHREGRTVSNCGAVDWGATTMCSLGLHDRCEHRCGGRKERGEWVAECYLLMPNERGHGYHWPTGRPRVIRPSHVYRCACGCHVHGYQANLFREGAS